MQLGLAAKRLLVIVLELRRGLALAEQFAPLVQLEPAVGAVLAEVPALLAEVPLPVVAVPLAAAAWGLLVASVVRASPSVAASAWASVVRPWAWAAEASCPPALENLRVAPLAWLASRQLGWVEPVATPRLVEPAWMTYPQ